MSRYVWLFGIFVCVAGVISIEGAQSQDDKNSGGTADADINFLYADALAEALTAQQRESDAAALRRKAASLGLQLEELRRTYGPSHPAVRKIEKQLSEMNAVEQLLKTPGPVKPDGEQAIQELELLDAWNATQSETGRREIEQQLRATLEERFQAQSAEHDLEIKRLEEKLQELRNKLEQRREKQEEIIEIRLQQLLLDAQGLGWGSEVPEPSNESSATHRRQPAATVEPSSASITPLRDPPSASITPRSDMITPDTIRSKELAVQHAKLELKAAEDLYNRKKDSDSLNRVELARSAVRRAEHDLESANRDLAWQLRSTERRLHEAQSALEIEKEKDSIVRLNSLAGSVDFTEVLEQQLAVERARHRVEEASDALSRLKESPAANE